MSSIQYATLGSDHAVPVEPVPEGGSVVVKVLAGAAVYYADVPSVSSSGNQGNLTAGNSATFTLANWLRSASSSDVSLTYKPPALPSVALSASTVDATGAAVNLLPVTDGSSGYAWQSTTALLDAQYVHQDGTGLPNSVAVVSSANQFTAKQTFKLAGVQVLTQDGNGNSLVLLQNIGGASHAAGAVQIFGENGLGTGASLQSAWQLGADTSASTPYRDFFLSKWLASNGVSDPDGIYISNGGASEPAGVGIGVAQPNDTGSLFRLKVQASGSGTANPDTAQGGLQVLWATGQTGDVFAAGSSNDSTGAFRIRSDGTILAHANQTSDVTVADAVTNATTTLTSATAGFQSSDVGKYVEGTNILAGSYIAAYVSATQVTLNQAASGSNAGTGALTMYGRAYQLRSNGNQPLFTIGSNGSSGRSVVFNTSVGIGSAADPVVNSKTVDIANIAGNQVSINIRQVSGGNLSILTSTSDVQIATQNSTPLRFGSVGPTVAMTITTAQDVIVGPGAKATPAELAQNATSAFFSIPTVPTGAPTGTPASTAIPTGATPMVYDRVEDKLYVWSKQQTKWVGVALA